MEFKKKRFSSGTPCVMKKVKRTCIYRKGQQYDKPPDMG